MTIANDSDKPLVLAWKSPEGELVKNGEIAAQSKVQIRTYLGHKFVWLDKKTEKPVPQGTFEIEAGSRYYRYGSKFSAVKK